MSYLEVMKRCLFLILTAFWLMGCIHRCEDPCVNGYCHEEACVCYNGYSGNTCDTQIEPSSIWIWEVKVANFPTSNEGLAWDPDGSGPDISPSLFFPGENDPFYSGYLEEGVRPDASPENNNAWEVYGEGRITELPQDIRCVLHDVEFESGNSLRIMGEATGPLYRSDNGFPATVTITEGDYSFELSVNYEW